MTRRADLATSRDPAFRRPLRPGEFEGPEWDDEHDGDPADEEPEQ